MSQPVLQLLISHCLVDAEDSMKSQLPLALALTAMFGPGQAAPLWESFVVRVGSEYIADRVKDGRFGAFMEVALVNDGPVTISLDSSR